jgi:hypothetical protein
MNRKLTLYIVLIGLVVLLLVVLDATKPKTIDWTPNYSIRQKTPYGLYIFDKEALKLFKGEKLYTFSKTPYEYFDENYDYESKTYKISGSFIAIEDRNSIDVESAEELLYFAEHGNTVLLSMKEFPAKLMDTLQVKPRVNAFFKDSIKMYLSNAPTKQYWYNEGAGTTFFDSLSKSKATALGYQIAKDSTGKLVPFANFIKVPFGKGTILLHSQPAAFTNFHLLKGSHYQYTEALLSQLPKGNIYWGQGKLSSGNISDSPLRYILSKPALKAAFWLGLIGLVVFVFFNAKRKQRIVPEIEPLRNTTVDFTKTIGNLYYQEGNHHTIIEKKIIYFLEHIRTEYLIDTYSLDEKFIEKLHLKTGRPVADIETAVHLIKKYRHQFESTEADVITINKAIENLRL